MVNTFGTEGLQTKGTLQVILLGIHRKSLFLWYDFAKGVEVESCKGGGCHHNSRLLASFPLATNKLPI
jgi:hypothetical protein